MNVFDLQASISLDTSKYTQNLSGASKNFEKFGKAVSTGMKTALKVGTAAVVGVGTAATVAGKKIVGLTSDVAEYGDNIDKMSQKMGISAKAYQEWDAIMQHSGTSIEALKPSMKTLATQAQKGAKEFQALGISQKEVKSLSQEDLFAKVISGLQDMEEGTKRTAITSKLLGRGAVELGALLNTSSKDTEKMRKRVNELGGVMSDKAVKAAAKYKDTLQDMQTALSATTRTLGSQFMPGITKVMEGLTSIFAGEEGGGSKIEKGVQKIFDTINNAIPKLGEVGASIISGIGNSILDNMDNFINFGIQIVDGLINSISTAIPKVADAAVRILDTINNGITSGISTLSTSATGIISGLISAIGTVLPKLLTTGINIIKEIGKGIASALPTLIPQAVSVVTELISTITSELPEVLQVGIDILMGLVDGIKSALPTLIDSAPQIVSDLATSIMDSIPIIIDAGTELLTSLVEDLPGIINNVVNAIPKIIQGLVDSITNPSSTGKIANSGSKLLTALVQNLPSIIGTVVTATPKIVVAIVGSIVKAIPQMAKAGFDFFVGLVKNIPSALQTALSKVGDFMSGIFDKIKSFDLIEVGKNLIRGLWDGIQSMAGWIKDKVTGFFSGITDAITGFLGINSPSRLYRDLVGKNMALGVGVGWDNAYPQVQKDITKSLKLPPTDYSRSFDISAYSSGSYSYPNSEIYVMMKKISKQLDTINFDVINAIDSADTTIVLNDREFGRAVRKAYA